MANLEHIRPSHNLRRAARWRSQISTRLIVALFLFAITANFAVAQQVLINSPSDTRALKPSAWAQNERHGHSQKHKSPAGTPIDPFWNPTSGGPSGAWDTTTLNWSPTAAGGSQAAWINGSDAVFSATGVGTGTFTVTIAKNVGLAANSITVNNAGSETITDFGSGGSTFGFGGDGITINSGAGAFTITGTGHITYSLTAAQTWTNNSSSLFTVSAPITNGAFLLTIGGTGNTTISDALGVGPSQSGGLTKNGTGILTLSGTAANIYTGLTTVNAGEVDLGKTGTANAIGSGGLTINGGTVKYTAAGTDEIANTANVTISGGTLDLNNHADTIGSLTFNSGTLTSTGGTQTLTLAGSTATTLQMQGGATIPTSVNLAFSSTTTSGVGMTFDASANGTATINGNINLNSTVTTGITRTFTINDGSAATDASIAGVISNTTATGLTKAGAGTLALSGANTYTGVTTINAGTLLVNNTTGSGTGTGAVAVNNSGTLGGSGTISGAVTLNNSAIINGGGTPGAVGTLNTGALTLNSTSVLSADMTATTADQINVTGAIVLASTTMLQLNIPNGTTFAPGQQFTLLNNDLADAITGTFSNAPAGTDVINGYAWMVSYTGGTGNDFVLTAIPEPSTWIISSLGVVALIMTRRRRLMGLLRAKS